MKLNFDDLDFFILNSIHSQKCIYTWDMAKKYLKIEEVDPLMKREINLKLKFLNTKIKARLRKMSKFGIVEITKEQNGNCEKNVYNLIKENIKFSKHRFFKKYHSSIIFYINGGVCALAVINKN